MSAYPEFRITGIPIYSGYHSFQVDTGGGWSTKTIADGSYGDILTINAECETQLGAGYTCAYNRNQRRFIWTKDAGTFKVRGNGDGLLSMLGFEDSADYAGVQTADYWSPYLYTCPSQFRSTDDFPWRRGADWDRLSRACQQTVSEGTGRVCQVFGLRQIKVRTTIVTCAPDEDADWLAEFLDLSPGMTIKILQDTDVTSAYAPKTNPWGYFLGKLDAKSYQDFQCKRSMVKSQNLQDFTFVWRVNP